VCSYLPPTWPSWPLWREVAAQKIPVTEAVITVLCTPDVGCGWHLKHVQWTCRIIDCFVLHLVGQLLIYNYLSLSNSPEIYESLNIIAVFTGSRHLSLPWASRILSISWILFPHNLMDLEKSILLTLFGSCWQISRRQWNINLPTNPHASLNKEVKQYLMLIEAVHFRLYCFIGTEFSMFWVNRIPGYGIYPLPVIIFTTFDFPCIYFWVCACSWSTS